MLKITDKLIINEDDIEIKFIRSPGPGGQHVNKVESAVQIRFDAKSCAAIDEGMYARLKKLAGRKITSEGIIVISANSTRSQVRNKEDAIERLVDLLKKATVRPKARKKTRPSLAAKRRRIETKKKRGVTKKLRNKKIDQ